MPRPVTISPVAFSVYSMQPIDHAWAVLKVDFSDIGPLPSTFKFHPDARPQPGISDQEAAIRQHMYQQDPKAMQRWMEESYEPDVQMMLELEALRQASGGQAEAGGQQVPRNLLMPRQNVKVWPLNEPEYGYEEKPWDRNWGATSSHEMLNIPAQGFDENLPLPQ